MTQRRARRRRRVPLDRAMVLDAAVELADRDGLEAVTMRRVGSVLGVEAMSLYHYIESKDVLLDGVVEQVVASMDVSGMDHGPWRERLKEGFRAYRRLAHDHPAVFPLIGRRPVRTLAALRPVDVALGVLREAGFSPPAALHGFRTLSSYAYGYALSEIRGFALESASGGTGPPPDVLRAEADRFPHLAEVIPEAGHADHDAEFEAGLEVILAGLESVHGAGRAPKRRRPPSR